MFKSPQKRVRGASSNNEFDKLLYDTYDELKQILNYYETIRNKFNEKLLKEKNNNLSLIGHSADNAILIDEDNDQQDDSAEQQDIHALSEDFRNRMKQDDLRQKMTKILCLLPEERPQQFADLIAAIKEAFEFLKLLTTRNYTEYEIEGMPEAPTMDMVDSIVRKDDSSFSADHDNPEIIDVVDDTRIERTECPKKNEAIPCNSSYSQHQTIITSTSEREGKNFREALNASHSQNDQRNYHIKRRQIGKLSQIPNEEEQGDTLCDMVDSRESNISCDLDSFINGVQREAAAEPGYSNTLDCHCTKSVSYHKRPPTLDASLNKNQAKEYDKLLEKEKTITTNETSSSHSNADSNFSRKRAFSHNGLSSQATAKKTYKTSSPMPTNEWIQYDGFVQGTDSETSGMRTSNMALEQTSPVESFRRKWLESSLVHDDMSSLGSVKDPKFTLHERRTLNHPVHSVSFSEVLDVVSAGTRTRCRLAATCGMDRVEIFALNEPAAHSINQVSSPKTQKREYVQHMHPIHVFSCNDKKEEYYRCVFGGRSQWQPDRNHQDQQLTTDASCNDWPQLLCVGGKRGTINVFDLNRKSLRQSLSGHVGEILEINLCPTNEWILLSASSDESLRIWNLSVGSCIAILAGHYGHKSSVICSSWNLSGTLIVSGGVDTTIKLWSTASDTVLGKAIVNSMKIGNDLLTTNKKGFVRPIKEQFPIFSTNKVHCQYVDCVQFVGDVIISKSDDQKIVMWLPIIDQQARTLLGTPIYPVSSDVTVLRTFGIPNSDVWYSRFTFLHRSNSLVVGNSRGEVFVWDVTKKSSVPTTKLSMRCQQDVVRCVQFVPEGNILIATLDSGNVFVYDVTYDTI